MSHLLVIGNGFDLDLGLKTRYSDFASSGMWPFKDAKTPLAEYLESLRTTEKWLDLEVALGEYADADEREFHIRRISPETNRSDYNTLVQSLCLYLKGEQQQEFDEHSTAAKILKRYIEGASIGFPEEYEIISFNYTDINLFAKKIGAKEEINLSHVHGSLETNDIILGFGDETDSRPDSVFMRKSFNVNYQPISVLERMADADEITFFGLSFGDIDYAYFDDFFTSILNYDTGERSVTFGKKELTFFTYDETSRLSILENINRRTGRRISSLYSFHNVQLIRTSDPADSKKIENYFARFDKALEDDRDLAEYNIERNVE